MNRRLSRSILAAAALILFTASIATAGPAKAKPAVDPVVQKIIELGQSDNRVMLWNDYASNRFGGRETGTNAYNDAAEWAAWQLRQWGLQAELEPAGEVPVGFNRGPWFGRMIAPVEKGLRFGTPSFTAGTRGVERGPVVILKSDPFSIPGRNAKPEDVEKKRAAVEAAVAEVKADPGAFRGAWVLIPGESSGFARDGRRGTPEYADSQLIPKLTAALVEAGARGTIQSSKTDPFRMLDGYVASWDKLPELPDIKLAEDQYNEIKGLAEKGGKVELEFDIRNWFKMGPVKYHNVVATLRGSEFPDEYIVLGGHFDCFSSATGAVDDGSGFAPSMEALRLIAAAGGRPRRSIVVILFAAEEQGLVGSQAWLKSHPGIAAKIQLMINRDGSPSAITGASVPETWLAGFQKISAPLAGLDPAWPFKLERGVPRARATSPGGTDSSAFEMEGVPTLRFLTQSDYNYNHAWHTLDDLYSELVPYAASQRHSALVTAVVAYGAANLERPLAAAGVYLADGLYAEITIGSADAPVRIMTTLDYANAPLQTANFVRIVEGPAGTQGGPGGFGPGPGPRPGMRPAGPGGPGRRPELPPIGRVEVRNGLIAGLVVSDVQKSAAVPALPLAPNAALRNDVAGVLDVTGPNEFCLTLKKKAGLDRTATAIGRTIAGLDLLSSIKKGDAIRSIRIVRVGQAARDFKTDDEAFQKLLGASR
ncbi:MAG TPA: M20/M25/M40 family metallo-hydrolase [Candidatus Aminicenantes bacterium]|nr:M20/M25/M40 family metallo-hydrolase [Candidatus Aminicenantes bacterium]HRY64812.1 M20/M25/M40 family metallo-hydrolase [Candidatus Aminicenantes bacterium]HRZ71725.1 M20/M25/M40 family metallo-hydrolase [Candidatus Aminicenantes bacterium]